MQLVVRPGAVDLTELERGTRVLNETLLDVLIGPHEGLAWATFVFFFEDKEL